MYDMVLEGKINFDEAVQLAQVRACSVATATATAPVLENCTQARPTLVRFHARSHTKGQLHYLCMPVAHMASNTL